MDLSHDSFRRRSQKGSRSGFTYLHRRFIVYGTLANSVLCDSMRAAIIVIQYVDLDAENVDELVNQSNDQKENKQLRCFYKGRS